MKKWWNNGKITKYCEICPEGFIPGRINKKLNEKEQLNADCFNNIINTVDKDYFINFYIYHNKQETLKEFNINSHTVLIRILKYFDYDFSKQKPSKFKGKKAVRSHESYISGGKKSAETQKINWEKKSNEEKEAWAVKQSLAHLNSPTFKDKITKSNRIYRFSLTKEEQIAMDKARSESMKSYWSNLSEEEKNEILFNKFKNGQHFNQKDTKPNLHFKSLLELNNINFEREICYDKKIFDFKINNILVEIDPTFTHNSTYTPFKYNSPTDKKYHKNKSEIALNNGFRCIHVFDWDDEDKIIELLKNTKETIYARNCEIREVEKQEAIDFISKYHLQNYANDKIRIGLYFNNKLISIMTFGKPRYNKNYEYELIRYCSSINVIGGAEKIFSYFIKMYKPGSVISYCDLSKFTGKTYEKLKFKLIRKSGPAKHWYNVRTKEHYTDNLLRQHGFSRLINGRSAKEDNLVGKSNKDLMIEHGFVEVYDCGQATYVWKN